MEIEEAIAQLDEGIRRLKVQYDMFFSGASIRPPTELRTEIERLIRRFSNSPIRRYSDRFHFNTLVGRFNSFAELWNKQLRAMEEGRERIAGAAPAARPEAERDDGEQVLFALRVSDPAAELDGLRTLFDSYLSARTQREGAPPRVTMDSFVNQISRQVDSLKASFGCHTVEFRITLGPSHVSIKARPADGQPKSA